MYNIIKRAEEFGLNRVFLASREFIEIIDELAKEKENIRLTEFVKLVLNKTGYTKALENENTIQADARIENIEEFLTVAMEFEQEEADNKTAANNLR